MKNDAEEQGIKGYAYPPSSINNKPIMYGIPKGKAYGGMLDTVLRSKKLVPSPS